MLAAAMNDSVTIRPRYGRTHDQVQAISDIIEPLAPPPLRPRRPASGMQRAQPAADAVATRSRQ